MRLSSIIRSFLITFLVAATTTSCLPLYEKGYNPTWWDYTVNTRNQSDQVVEFYTISREGYDRTYSCGRDLKSRGGGNGYYLGQNLSLRGTARAIWQANGKNYICYIDLGKLGLRSYKDGCLFFEFIGNGDKIRVYAGSRDGEPHSPVIEVLGKPNPDQIWHG